MSELFYQINIVGLARENEDRFTSWAFENGAQGVSEKLEFTQPDLTFESVAVETAFLDAEVYFYKPPEENVFLELQREFPEAKYVFTQHPHEDWLEEWKKGFEPFQFVGDFWVIPSWRPVPPEAKIPLFIDPGMAFGTGTHETTQIAGVHVDRCLREYNIDSAIDVGTGTGILALLAEKRGVDRVEALDIDPECRRVSKENLALNKADRVKVLDGLTDQVTDQFDLVIANIIDGVLIQLRAELMRLTKPNGHLIISGILEENEEHFKKEFLSKKDHSIVSRIEKGEWISYWLRKDL